LNRACPALYNRITCGATQNHLETNPHPTCAADLPLQGRPRRYLFLKERRHEKLFRPDHLRHIDGTCPGDQPGGSHFRQFNDWQGKAAAGVKFADRDQKNKWVEFGIIAKR